jgi:hypothetical protein
VGDRWVLFTAASTRGDFRFRSPFAAAESANKYKTVTEEDCLQNTSVAENAHVISRVQYQQTMVGDEHCNECSSKAAKIIVKKLHDFVSPCKGDTLITGKMTLLTQARLSIDPVRNVS